MMIENKIGGKRGDPGYVIFPLAYESIEELWKKYDNTAFVEIHLIYNSLAQKKKQIEDLVAQNTELAARVQRLETVLKNAIH